MISVEIHGTCHSLLLGLGRDLTASIDSPLDGKPFVTLLVQVRVEKDYTVYGDECKFGGGKVSLAGVPA